MKLLNSLILLIIISVSTNVFAESTELPKENISADLTKEIKNTNQPKPKFGTGQQYIFAEAMIAVNAGLASLSPKAYGIAGVILFPIATANGPTTSNTTRWVGFGAVESLAVYNITINENKKSKGEIFLENIIAWHLVAGIVGLTDILTGDQKKDTTVSLDYVPTKNGGGLLLSKRF
jgi:hypothetical protein